MSERRKIRGRHGRGNPDTRPFSRRFCGLSGRRRSSHRAAADRALPGRLHDINLKALMFIKI